MKFVLRNDFENEQYHSCLTYTTEGLVDNPEGYFGLGEFWDGGTSGGDIAKKHDMDVYYFWRTMEDGRLLGLLEVYAPVDAIAYFEVQLDNAFGNSHLMIEDFIYDSLLDDVLSALKEAMGL